MLDVIPEADIASLGVRLCGMLHFLPTTQAREVRALLKDEYRLMERDKGMANAGNVALISLIHKGGGPTLVLRPRNEGEKPSGTLLFLHGAGAPMMMYPWLLAGLADRENLIVVCPSWRGGEWSESGAAEHALEQLRAVMSAQNTDAQRTYLGGISMGGAGGWRVLDADARVFRGFICISGYGMPATDISIPIFMVEGGQDSVAATEAELRRVNSLSRLVLLPNDDHFVFLRSRKQVTDAVCDWMDLIEE